MAVKTYRALRKGYVDGRVIDEGEVFSTEFTEVVREEPTDTKAMKRFEKGEGPKPIGDIKRDKDGNAVTKPVDAPSWAEEIGKKEAAAAEAADADFDDVPLEGMQIAALQAYAAERNVDPTGLGKKDLITAIKAARDITR